MKGYIRFSPTGDLGSLSRILERLSHEKTGSNPAYPDEYRKLPSASMLGWFARLTSADEQELLRVFEGLSLEQIIQFGLIPGRPFRSMIHYILGAEYRLVAEASLISRSLVSYIIEALPYGGNPGLLALLECSQNPQPGFDDGFGYRHYAGISRG